MKYRIVQNYKDDFVIEVKTIVKTGFLWWKKEQEIWRRCNIYGNDFVSYRINLSLPAFNTLKEAKEQIRRFNAKPIYHYDY